MSDDSEKSNLQLALEAMLLGEEEARRSVAEQLRVLNIQVRRAKPLGRADFLPAGWKIIDGGRKG